MLLLKLNDGCVIMGVTRSLIYLSEGDALILKISKNKSNSSLSVQYVELISKLEELVELFKKIILGWSPGDRCLANLMGSSEKEKSV